MAFINGDGEHTWGPDPELTPLGHEQTKAVGVAWKREAAAGAPVDKLRFFTSPLQRTCQTMLNSWGDMLKSPETWEVSSPRRSSIIGSACRIAGACVETDLSVTVTTWRCGQ